MPVNAGPEYFAAEKKYLAAQTDEQRIAFLEEMIRGAPKHKSSEHFVANLKQRLKKFEERKEKARKTGSSTKKAIKKEGYQCVIIGFPNVGKSSLLEKLTNAKPKISHVPFTTKQPEIGTLIYQGLKTQIVDLPAIGSEGFDIGIVNTADRLLVIIEKLEDIQRVEPHILRAKGKRVYLINKSDLLSIEEKRKLEANIRSKKINGLMISTITGENIDILKNKIVNEMDAIRIYLKEPGKPASSIPMIMPTSSTVKDVAEKILKGFSLRIKETKVTGPSSKFPNQKVGLSHVLKDRDIVEFSTK